MKRAWLARAEAGSFLHVEWPFPVPAIDLYAEYMTVHNSEMSRVSDSKAGGYEIARIDLVVRLRRKTINSAPTK